MEDAVDALIKELFQKQELHREVSELEIIDAVIERGLPLFYVTVVSEGLRQKATANSLLESSSVMSIAHDKDDTQTVINDSCSKHSLKERKRKYDSAYVELSAHEPLFVKESFFSDEMDSWSSKYIGEHFNSPAGRRLLIEATFAQANADGVTVLEIGEDVWGLGEFFHNDIGELIDAFQEANYSIAPEVELRLQIGLLLKSPMRLTGSRAQA